MSLFKKNHAADQDHPLVALFNNEQELEFELAHKRRALARFEQNVGGEYLDGDQAGVVDLGRRLAEARGEIDVLDAAIQAARQRRVDAIQAKRNGEAARQRDEAGHWRAQAVSVRKKAAGLLAQLAGVLDVPDFDISILRLRELPEVGRAIAHEPAPLYTRLEEQARTAEGRADALEIPADTNGTGQASGASPEELYAATRVDPLILTPTLSAIETWCAHQLRELIEQKGERSVPVRFTVHWRGAEITTGSGCEYLRFVTRPADPGAGYRERGFPDPYVEEPAVEATSEPAGAIHWRDQEVVQDSTEEAVRG